MAKWEGGWRPRGLSGPGAGKFRQEGVQQRGRSGCGRTQLCQDAPEAVGEGGRVAEGIKNKL